MQSESAVEQRLATLEAEVAELKRQMAVAPGPGNWLDRIVGSMEGNPAFEEAMRLAHEWRQNDRPKDED